MLSPSDTAAPATELLGTVSQAAAPRPELPLAPPALRSAPQLGEHALVFWDLLGSSSPGLVLQPGAGGQDSEHLGIGLAGTPAAALAAALSAAPASALAGHGPSPAAAAAAEASAGGARPQKLRHRRSRRSSSLRRFGKHHKTVVDFMPLCARHK